MSAPVTIAAATGIAPSASRWRVRSGSKNGKRRFSRRTIFMSSSRSPNRSRPLLTRTKVSSTAFCSEPRPRPCPPSRPIPNVWGQRSAFWQCFIPGDKTFIRTLTHNAWHHQLLDFQATTHVDFPCDPLVEGACLSDGGARECCAPALCSDRSDEFPKEHAERVARGSIGRPPPTVRWNGDSRRIAELLHSS